MEELMKEQPESVSAPESIPAGTEKKKKKIRVSLPKGKKKKRGLVIAVVVIVLLALAAKTFLGGGSGAPTGSGYVPVQVIRQDLTVSVDGTGTLEPADSYAVKTLSSGEIMDAPFEEGALVEKDTLLYVMDSTAAQENVGRANISVEQMRLSYQQAQEALRPTATIAGTLNEVYVHDGDNVTPGTALCKIVTSTDLSVDFLFPYASASSFYVGQAATVFIGNFDGSVSGSVVSVSDGSIITSDGRQACTVRVKLTNPGVVSTSFSATAVVGSYSSYGSANIIMPGSATVYATGSGTVTGFEKTVGSVVRQGDSLCTIESDATRSGLETARLSLESAQLSAKSAVDALDDCNIKSPIAGTVIEKNFKTGDKVDGGESGNLAVIYDLSYLKLQMPVNELDISKVAPGQSVEITSSALDGITFTGVVDKVSINGTTTNGFTTYPVTIRVDEYGELKPGMNVSISVLGETAKDALCVPVNAVARGNTVQVALPGAVGEDGVTLIDPTQVETRDVILGVNDDEYIQITSGLEEGDTVLVLSAPEVLF